MLLTMTSSHQPHPRLSLFSLGWPGTPCVSQVDFRFTAILLPQPLRHLDRYREPPHIAHALGLIKEKSLSLTDPLELAFPVFSNVITQPRRERKQQLMIITSTGTASSPAAVPTVPLMFSQMSQKGKERQEHLRGGGDSCFKADSPTLPCSLIPI